MMNLEKLFSIYIQLEHVALSLQYRKSLECFNIKTWCSFINLYCKQYYIKFHQGKYLAVKISIKHQNNSTTKFSTEKKVKAKVIFGIGIQTLLNVISFG